MPIKMPDSNAKKSSKSGNPGDTNGKKILLFEKSFLRIIGISDILWSRLSRSGGRSWRVVIGARDSLSREVSITVWSNIYSGSLDVSEWVRRIENSSSERMPILSISDLKSWAHSSFNLTKSSTITSEIETHSLRSSFTGEICSLESCQFCLLCESVLTDTRKHCGSQTTEICVVGISSMKSSSFIYLPQLTTDLTVSEWGIGDTVAFSVLRRKCTLISSIQIGSTIPAYCEKIEFFKERNEIGVQVEQILQGEQKLESSTSVHTRSVGESSKSSSSGIGVKRTVEQVGTEECHGGATVDATSKVEKDGLGLVESEIAVESVEGSKGTGPSEAKQQRSD